MDLNNEVIEILMTFGVGRRDFDDSFFNEKPPVRLGIYDLDEENLCHELVLTNCNIPGCKFSSENLLEYESHYNAAHRYACSQCKRVLPSPHFLDLHLQETHDSFFAVLSAKKPSYSCYIEECKDMFLNAEERFDHCVKVHKLPKDFRFEQAAKKAKSKKNKSKNRPERMEIPEAADNTEDMSKSSTAGNTGIVNLTPMSMSVSVVNVQGTNSAVPKNFSFGHSKNKGFPKYSGQKFTDSKLTSSGNENVDIDEVMTDLRESLPE